MARWKLTTGHYLMVDGVNWEYTEINNQGKQARKRYVVPMFLDPKDEQMCNGVDVFNEPILVVSNGEGAQPRDIIFKGDPTPDMEPLDDEATAISNTFRPKWDKAGVGVGGSEGLLGQFEAQLSAAMANSLSAIAAPVAQTSTQVDAVLLAMAEMMKQNQQILSALVGTSSAAAVPPAKSASADAVAPVRRL